MKLAADYRALARDALRGRWKTAVLAGLLASALGANIVNATENITSNANRANQNSNITPGGSLELFSQANGGRLLAVLVVCIVVWTLFTLVVGGAVRLGYARFNLNLADGKAAAVSDLFSQKGPAGWLLPEIFSGAVCGTVVIAAGDPRHCKILQLCNGSVHHGGTPCPDGQ